MTLFLEKRYLQSFWCLFRKVWGINVQKTMHAQPIIPLGYLQSLWLRRLEIWNKISNGQSKIFVVSSNLGDKILVKNGAWNKSTGHKSEGFQVRDYSTWVRHGNKKEHTEEGRTKRWAPLSHLPIQSWEAQHRHTLSCGRSMKWVTYFTADPSAGQTQILAESHGFRWLLKTKAPVGPRQHPSP